MNLGIIMVSETKKMMLSQSDRFFIEGFSKPYRLDSKAKSAGISLSIRDHINVSRSYRE